MCTVSRSTQALSHKAILPRLDSPPVVLLCLLPSYGYIHQNLYSHIQRIQYSSFSQEKVSNIYDVDACIPKHTLSPNTVCSIHALWDKLY